MPAYILPGARIDTDANGSPSLAEVLEIGNTYLMWSTRR
jgi:hypothetical protein